MTFTVYADDAGTERIFPFSLIPRVIDAEEWARLEAGLVQRVTALNRFLADIYTDQRCVTDGVIPANVLGGSEGFELRAMGFVPPLGVYAHIAGIDLIRDAHGEYRVLEDNLRTPSGVSYVLENRRTMLNAVPDLFPTGSVAPVDDYPDRLLDMLIAVRPDGISAEETRAVILTPGSPNSAYFEHSFLARQMGIELVEGPTCWSTISACTCARRLDWSACTSSTAGWTTSTSTRWSSSPTRCWASRASWTRTAAGR